MRKSILIVDDDENFRAAVRKTLDRAYSVTEAATVEEFEERFRPHTYDLVILDIRLRSDREGMEILREIQAWDENQPVIMASAYGDTDSVVEAAEGGALMFLHKGEFTPQLAMRLVEAVLQQARVRRQVSALRSRLATGEPVELMGLDPAIRHVGALIRQASEASEAIVSIGGEFGTGHEQVAAVIHDRSKKRASGPLAMANAGGWSGDDARAELLGLPGVRGGLPRRKGILERTHGGLLFLGGFDLLPPALQAEVGHAMRQGELSLSGGRVVPIDVQLVVGCGAGSARRISRLLREAANTDSAIEIHLPALRERRDDISLLATYILQEARRRHSLCARTYSREAMREIEANDWRGNLKEMRSALEYAAIKAAVAGSDEVLPEHLPWSMRAEPSVHEGPHDYRATLARAELALLASAVHEGMTNKGELATHLGYNDRFALGRRARKALEEFPGLAEEFPRVAVLFPREAKS